VIESSEEYGALVVDTSVFITNGLRLEKGLLSRLQQFRRSPIDFVLPDVIRSEVEVHLEKEMRKARADLEKAINDASDHLFFDDVKPKEARELLIDQSELEKLVRERMDNFLEKTGATQISCSELTNISAVMGRYFSNRSPFSESGKKKNEFPDAIILLSLEEWSKQNNKKILAVAKDNDWKRFCEESEFIDCEEDFASGLAVFNATNTAYNFLHNLENSIQSGTAKSFLDAVRERLAVTLSDFTPDQEADSHLYWEPDGCHAWFKDFEFISDELDIIESDEDWIVIRGEALISVEAEGDFSLSLYDSIDREHVYMGGISVVVDEEFESDILITITGDLSESFDNIQVDDVEVTDVIGSIDFGTLEPNFQE
tara:strand:+ start:3243 stop:4355 length:1113 start_codon:yes stop_codon:yes gene_type:complete